MQLVPRNRAKPKQDHPRPRTWPITAIGRLSTDRELDLEARRQLLLNRRWRRWQSIIFTLMVSIGVLGGAVPIYRAIHWLLSLG